MEEDEPGADSDDTEEEPDKDFGTVEYFTDRVEEDGVLWWGVYWVETQEATWCLDTNIPKISKYNKMRAAGEKGQFMLRFDGKSQIKKKRGKNRRKDRKGGPLPAALHLPDVDLVAGVELLGAVGPPPVERGLEHSPLGLELVQDGGLSFTEVLRYV